LKVTKVDPKMVKTNFYLLRVPRSIGHLCFVDWTINFGKSEWSGCIGCYS